MWGLAWKGGRFNLFPAPRPRPEVLGASWPWPTQDPNQEAVLTKAVRDGATIQSGREEPGLNASMHVCM